MRRFVEEVRRADCHTLALIADPRSPQRPQLVDYHAATPDADGHFGRFGGTLRGRNPDRRRWRNWPRPTTPRACDPAFIAEFEHDLAHYVGRPSPIYDAERLSDEVGGARILLKREDLNHTGAHKINNTIGQALLASRMGKTRIIAETGAGQHGVASATVAARLGPGMRGLHGRDRHRAPEDQRLPHEAARRDRRAGAPAARRR